MESEDYRPENMILLQHFFSEEGSSSEAQTLTGGRDSLGLSLLVLELAMVQEVVAGSEDDRQFLGAPSLIATLHGFTCELHHAPIETLMVWLSHECIQLESDGE